MTIPSISLSEVKQRIAKGHCVFGYPRKREILVNGFMRFACSAATAQYALDACRASLREVKPVEPLRRFIHMPHAA